jgi:hypothetical protein
VVRFSIFKVGGSYTFNFATDGYLQVKLAGGQNTNVSDAAFSAVEEFDLTGLSALNLTGITFKEADASGGLEPDVNLNVLINELLTTSGVAGTLDMLTVNGTKADAFKLIWDFLDDGYTYYDTARAKAFVELGAEYVKYLQAGGEPLLDVTAKFTADDNMDENTTPEREQSLHDNLLGNLHSGSIKDRFFDGVSENGEPTGSATHPNETLGLELLELVDELGLNGRPYYGGNEGEANLAREWEQQNFPEWFI